MAVDIFLKLDPLKGESLDTAHKGEIDVLSWGWGLDQTGTFHHGSGGGAGKVNVHDLSFAHHVDTASTDLMNACMTGSSSESLICPCPMPMRARATRS